MSIITKITMGILNFLGIIGFFWGVSLIFTSIATPGRYSLYSASAVQATQVYSEAIMYAMQGCGLILAGIFIHVALNINKPNTDGQMETLAENTARTNTLLNNLGKVLTRR